MAPLARLLTVPSWPATGCASSPRTVAPRPWTDAALRSTLECDPRGTHLVIVQGVRCSTWGELLDQWAAACEFPACYGRNRDAFDECTGDLLELDETGTAGLGHAFGDRVGRRAGVPAVRVMGADAVLAAGQG